jgi:ribosomal-protein-alanine N-acetyltransferase
MNPAIDISNVTLKTKRMILRPWCESDLDDFYEYASVDGVGQMAGWQPHENKQKSQDILTLFINGKKTFAMEYNGKAIGSIGVEEYKETEAEQFADQKCRELGFVLSKDYWGMGLMPEAVNEVLRYLFEDVKLDAVFCGYFVRNKQSARVQEKCGFKFLKCYLYQTQVNTLELTNYNVLKYSEWKRNHDE